MKVKKESTFFFPEDTTFSLVVQGVFFHEHFVVHKLQWLCIHYGAWTLHLKFTEGCGEEYQELTKLERIFGHRDVEVQDPLGSSLDTHRLIE